MKSENNNLIEVLKKYWLPGSGAVLLVFALFIIVFRLGQSAGPEFPRLEPGYTAKQSLDFSPFTRELEEFSTERAASIEKLLTGTTIPEIQQLLHGGELTSVELVTWYLDRIRRYDVDRLNAILELNPEALDIAARCDRERMYGLGKQLMFGIPVLLKDNIATHDRMHTTAGAYALKDWQPGRDAFLVQQLRVTGAIILGKTNLSEWANYMDPSMPSGFSTLGGQVRNPYGPYEVWGSSSGSAVAAAAGLATVTVGTETKGSLIMPAAINGAVAIKTSMGLVSRDNIIPLIDWMDVPGPMGRSVTDVAILLTAMTGVDKNDAATHKAVGLAGTDFIQFLDLEKAAKLRIGIIVQSDTAIAAFMKANGVPESMVEDVKAQLLPQTERARQAGEVFSALGMEVVEVDGSQLPTGADISFVLEYGFKDSLNRFLAQPERHPPLRSLAQVITVNDEDPENRAPYGQGYLTASNATAITATAYTTTRDQVRSTYRKRLQELFAQNSIDVLITELQPYAPAGLPAITVPAGYDDNGQPFAVTMIADFLGEPALISAAYAYEQQTKARVEPNLPKTIQEIEQRLQ